VKKTWRRWVRERRWVWGGRWVWEGNGFGDGDELEGRQVGDGEG